MTGVMPIENLRRRARAQRQRIHDDLAGLRREVRTRTDPQRLARENLGPAAAVAGITGLIAGYMITGVFTRD
jgi:hypothetical protein